MRKVGKNSRNFHHLKPKYDPFHIIIYRVLIVVPFGGSLLKMQLFVRGQNLHTFDVTGGECVFDLKNEIAFAEGIPADEQVLFYAGKPLDDDLSLLDCGVADLSTLEVGLRLLGGMNLQIFFLIIFCIGHQLVFFNFLLNSQESYRKQLLISFIVIM